VYASSGFPHVVPRLASASSNRRALEGVDIAMSVLAV